MKLRTLIFLAAGGIAGFTLQGQAADINLGAAGSFGVLGGSAVSNTGPTTIVGDLGVNPGTSITGFPPGIVSGVAPTDVRMKQAHDDAAAAYAVLAGLAVTADLTTELGGRTLTPGIYRLPTASLTGTLTLDGQGQAHPLFAFLIGTTFGTAANSSVVGINGGGASSIYFDVGTAATLGAGTIFNGTIISSTGETLGAGATVNGRIIALGGAVTLDTDQINVPVGAVPEPASMLVIGAAAVLARRKRQN